MFKTLTRIGLAGLMALTSLAHAAETAPESLRIGYQKGSVSMVLAKSHQLLEKRFPDTKFSWVEFPAGPQMLEALNVGSIDLGSTGDIPPIFAQAAGADLVFVPGILDADVTRQLVDGIGERKVSVIGLPGALSAAEYEALGVARISYGPTTQRVALTALQDVAAELYKDGVIPASTRALN